jgi:hypothetical protein
MPRYINNMKELAAVGVNLLLLIYFMGTLILFANDDRRFDTARKWVVFISMGVTLILLILISFGVIK